MFVISHFCLGKHQHSLYIQYNSLSLDLSCLTVREDET